MICLMVGERFGGQQSASPLDRERRQHRSRSRRAAYQVIAVGAATVAAAPETDATW
jgi:hypothetical protein